MSSWRVVVEMTSPHLGGVGTNTWHFRSLDDQDSAIQSYIDRLEEFYASLDGLYAASTTISCTGEVRTILDDEPQVKDVTGWTAAVDGGGNPLPPSNCIVATLRTSVPTRSGRGRVFLGPMGISTLQDNGTPREASRDLVVSAFDTFIIGTDFPEPGAFGVYSPTGGVIRDIVRVSVPNEYAVLRSRRD